ncbi:MAG: LytR family transcriptional regulator [Gaiellales bacterium]|nr:MAG: LytR family transcriptional regulator [Gaiellales bacterium]
MTILRSSGRHYRKPALWKRIVKWTLLSVLGIALIAGAAGFFLVYHTLGKIGEDTELIFEARQELDIPPPDQPVNVLVLGTDEDPDGDSKRSDTMMLVRLNPEGQCVSLLSIPRDLLVDIPEVGEDKINAAYAIGDVPLAIDTVRELTGQPIHHFVMINYTGFADAVDSVGGVYVDIDQRYFNDNTDVYYGEEYEPIDIQPGYQRLGGQDALDFVRYRHTDSDFVRIRRQHNFINDVKAQTVKWGNVTNIPSVADAFASNTTSDIGRADILSYTKFVLGVDRNRVYQATVPVLESNGAYLTVDDEQFEEILAQFENPVFETPAPPVPEAEAARTISDSTRGLTIEVLNGNGSDGSAGAAAELLSGNGCVNVVVGGNANNTYEENQIYFRDGHRKAADEIAALLAPARVQALPPELDTNGQLLVVVGSSFDAEAAAPEAPAPAAVNFADDLETGSMSWSAAALELPFRPLRPTRFPVEFDYEDFRTYEIDTDDGPRAALKVVGTDQLGNYWGIMETTFTDAPLLENPSAEREVEGRTFRFYYAEGGLRYLAWQEGDVVIWVSNTLQNNLSEETMIELALSFKQVDES